MVEIVVRPSISRLVERCELTVLDEWPDIVIPSETPELLVVISLVTGQSKSFTEGSLEELREAFHAAQSEL